MLWGCQVEWTVFGVDHLHQAQTWAQTTQWCHRVYLLPRQVLFWGLNGGTFTYEDLEAATNRFNEANQVGQGGFGYVHKGVLPTTTSPKYGNPALFNEWKAEMEMMAGRIKNVRQRLFDSLTSKDKRFCFLPPSKRSSSNLPYCFEMRSLIPYKKVMLAALFIYLFIYFKRLSMYLFYDHFIHMFVIIDK